MATLVSSTVLRTFLFILVLWQVSTSATYSYSLSSFKRLLKTCLNPEAFWNGAGLYLPNDETRHLLTHRQLEDVFVMESNGWIAPFNGSCLVPSEVEGEEDMMPQCGDGGRGSPGAENWAGTIRGCCNTIMRIEFPQTVTSIITRQRHRVLQFSFSSQLVHTGRCQKEGGACVLGGRCTTLSRVQWVLVRRAPLRTNRDDDDDDDDDNDESVLGLNNAFFVPVMVPNHCQCIFT